ncbi:MAG: response regulator [Chitinivibrionales bacterium]|nr:response regulator [Chitinivibrionales bacterium]
MKTSPSVLIVEDEAAMVMALKARFKAGGFSVIGSASSKEEAVSLALEKSPDYIIMDIRLSGESDGIEAAQEIADKLNTHIIFITGYSEGDTRRRAMQVKPVAYLVKPFAISELISIMSHDGGGR